MRVLITGAGGFVGKCIVNELKKNNSKDYCFELYELHNNRKKSENFENDFEGKPNNFRADISNFEALKNSITTKQIDVVIHAAALAHQFGKQIKEDFFRINSGGTENVARLAVLLKAKHFILISSVAVYGGTADKAADLDENSFDGLTEDSLCQPEGFYAQSKLAAEKIATNICTENKIALTILRPVTVIGEGDRGNVARLIEAIDKRRFIWIGSGENHKSLIYKNDVARACLKVIDKKVGFNVFNVTAEPVKINQIVSTISRELEVSIPKYKISPKMLYVFFQINTKITRIEKVKKLAATAEKWLSEDVFSGEKFNREYGFRAETNISEAIKRQVESYKKMKKTR